ncbi:MAG: hypothetical protein ACFFD8_04740 [Candidatus Thorarchaeota archaeon]
MSKKVEELAQVLENVATIFLNGVGALEKQLEDMRRRLSKIETQVDTVLRMGGPATTLKGAPGIVTSETPIQSPHSPGIPPPSSPMDSTAPPGLAGPPPQTPPSPTGDTGGIGIRAQMQGELQSFLARRRAALEASLDDED